MKEKIVVVRYNAGNVGSITNALLRLNVEAIVSADLKLIEMADKVIFPGVGEASSTMSTLKENGLADLLPNLKQPVLGICLGMQLMCSYSEEGNTQGLGIFPERVKRFRIAEKIPHMGWNSVDQVSDALFRGLPDPAWFYFVHSYYAQPDRCTVATAHHGLHFGAFLRKGNFYAVQFHPEKSGPTGLQLLKNFIEL